MARPSGRPLTTLPGPHGLPLLGNLLQLKATQLPTILERWADRYGPLYTFRLGRKPVVVVAEPALIQTVLRHRPETYRRLHTIAAAFDDLGEQGVFTAEGRALAAPASGGDAGLERAAGPPILSDPDGGDDLSADPVGARGPRGRGGRYPHRTDALHRRGHHPLHVWGRPPGPRPRGEGLEPYLAQILPTINRRCQALVPYWHVFPLPADRAFARALAALRTVMAAALARARARLAQNPPGATPPSTVLEALLVARDAEGRAWSDDEILSNLLTMLVAGEDTTAHTMSWMLHFMTDVPAVQQAMQQEADAVLGAARMLPDVQTQDQLPYIDAVAQETMRLKSVAPPCCSSNPRTPWISAGSTYRRAPPSFSSRGTAVCTSTRFPTRHSFSPPAG